MLMPVKRCTCVRPMQIELYAMAILRCLLTLAYRKLRKEAVRPGQDAQPALLPRNA